MNDRGRLRLWLRRGLLWGAAAIVVGAVLWVAFRERPVLVDIAVTRRGPMRVTVDDDGVTRIRERYVVSSPLAGRMRRIDLDVGDSVTADETTLVRMEPSSAELLDPRAVAQAQARVRAAERRFEQAEAELRRVELAVDFAEREMSRLRRLVENDAASEKELLEQELDYRQQVQRARAAEFAVDIARYELELERAALLLTEPDEDDTRETEDSADMVLDIPAPITGRILRLYEESSAVVAAGQPLLEIGDPHDLEVVVDVLSKDAVRVHPGNHVVFEQWGGGEPLEGRVRLVEPSGFTKVSALGVEEQRVNVIIDFLQPPEKRDRLGDGFRVDCRIVVWQADDVLHVPTSALFRDGTQWQLFVVRERRARLTDVQAGKDNGEIAQITEGLDEGDEVIVYPAEAVADGVLVEPRYQILTRSSGGR